MIKCIVKKESTINAGKKVQTFTSIKKAIAWMKLQDGNRCNIEDTQKCKIVRKFGRGYGKDRNWYDLYTKEPVS